MKSTMLITVAAIGILSSCAISGSDQWKIKSATTKYVKQELKNGEKIQSVNIERKLSCYVKGLDCKYAEVKCCITSSGKTMTKTLYLLMSENCDSVYDISGKFNDDYFEDRK